MNNIFKQKLQRYIDGDLDTIYEELPRMAIMQNQQEMTQNNQPIQERYMPQPQPQPQPQPTMYPVYNPYDQQQQQDVYGLEYLDRNINENAKKVSVELAEKILKTQTKVDYYKAMKKKASIKLEEHLKRKENDCEPLVQLFLSSKLENVIHDGHKLTLVNGKNKKYIKITKLK